MKSCSEDTIHDFVDNDFKYEAAHGFVQRFEDIFDSENKFKDQIQHLIDGNNVQEIYIVGHSLGGAIASNRFYFHLNTMILCYERSLLFIFTKNLT